jgi:hypothetical protein
MPCYINGLAINRNKTRVLASNSPLDRSNGQADIEGVLGETAMRFDLATKKQDFTLWKLTAALATVKIIAKWQF